jgi:hypothetical protein
MPTYSFAACRQLIALWSLLSGGVLCALADGSLPQPILSIGLVWETNAPITVSPLGWASRPVLVDLKTKTVHVRSAACDFAASVVCSNEPALAVQILSPAGHTNEMEWTSDLMAWTPSNVRWISDGDPVSYYIPYPVSGRLYRVRYSNSAPKAALTISPLVSLPGPTNPVAISLNQTDAEVLLDASASSDPENDPLQFTWVEGTNVIATTVRTTKRLGLGLHKITLHVSDGLATVPAAAELETITAANAVNLLIALVQATPEVDIAPRNRRSFVAPLEAAAAGFDRGNLTAGINQLQAFQNQVWAQLVSFHQGNTNLIAVAEAIIRAVQR